MYTVICFNSSFIYIYILNCILLCFEHFLTYIYLSKYKYNKKYKDPHKTTQDEQYVQKELKRTEQIGTNAKVKKYLLHSRITVIELVCDV